jgi:hypothetical protein
MSYAVHTHSSDVTARKEEANKCQFVSTPLCCVIHFLFHGIKGFGNVPEAGRQAGRPLSSTAWRGIPGKMETNIAVFFVFVGD